VYEEAQHRVKEERNILKTMQRWKAVWIGHILSRNCFLRYFIEGKVERKDRIDSKTRRNT
jgi:hypothetical protein